MGRGSNPKGGKKSSEHVHKSGKGRGTNFQGHGNYNCIGTSKTDSNASSVEWQLTSGTGICWNAADCDDAWVFLGRELLRGRRQVSFTKWSGCRADKAMVSGRGAFAVRNETGGNMRVGWSLGEASLELGMDEMSFGYGGTAMKSTGGKYTKYGQTYGQDDIIVALLDLDRHAMSFMKNGHCIPGDAFVLPQQFWGRPFYPHALTKEATITAYFGGATQHFEVPNLPSGFSWLADLELVHSDKRSYCAINVQDDDAIVGVDTATLEQGAHRDQFEEWKVKVNKYVTHFQQPLRWEYQAERQSVLNRVKRSLGQLESTGFGCSGLHAELTEQRIVLTRPQGIPRLTEISIGRTVLLTAEDNIVTLDDAGSTIIGEVETVNDRCIVVSTTYDSLPRGDLFRLDLGPNHSTYERIDRVLDRLQSCEKPSKKVKNRMGIVSPCTDLADSIFADVGESSGSAMCWDPSSLPKPNSKSDISIAARASHLAVPLRKPVGDIPVARQLEKTQAIAKDMVVKECRKLSIIQGPPGTGKTTTAIEIIIGWLQSRKGPILATAFSNKGVNNLAEGLHRRGVNVLRIGICDAELEYSMEAHLEWYGYDCSKGMGKGARKGLQNDVISKADVICATIVGSGMGLLRASAFPFVIVDEAAQIIEPACLIPLSKESVQVVMVGDQCQLPATVLSHEAQKAGLDVSLFDRLLTVGMEVHMLSVQYRMHPIIAEFSSWRFYGHKLETGISPKDRPTVALRGISIDTMGIVHVATAEKSQGMSKANQGEANCIEYLLHALKGSIFLGDVGVITPYSAQVLCIRQHLASLGSEGHHVQVSSVDAFQGSEKEVILLSMVRSNSRGDIGFVSDWRRLNVAATRARRLLIIVGNVVTLSQHALWRDFLGFHLDLHVLEWAGSALSTLGEETHRLIIAARDISRARGIKPLPLRGDYPLDGDFHHDENGEEMWKKQDVDRRLEMSGNTPLVSLSTDEGWDDPPLAEVPHGGWNESSADFDAHPDGQFLKLVVGPRGAGLELAPTRWGMRIEGIEHDSPNMFEIGSTIVAISGTCMEQNSSSDEELCRVEELFGTFFADGASIVLASQEEMLLGWDSLPDDVSVLSDEFDLSIEYCPKGLLVYGPARALCIARDLLLMN